MIPFFFIRVHRRQSAAQFFLLFGNFGRIVKTGTSGPPME
jgi:hypothetical protein